MLILVLHTIVSIQKLALSEFFVFYKIVFIAERRKHLIPLIKITNKFERFFTTRVVARKRKGICQLTSRASRCPA